MGAEWSSLEFAKLAVAALTPIILFVLGYKVTQTARRIEQAQWTRQKLVERRLELYEEMAPKLNDLFCCFTLVGHFQEVTPPEAILRKRATESSTLTHRYSPLSSGTATKTSSTSVSPISSDLPSRRGSGRRWRPRSGSGRPGSLSGTQCSNMVMKARPSKLPMHTTT